MSTLLDEIHQQPGVLSRLLAQQSDAIDELADEIRRRDIANVLIAARGSSDNAAVYAKYVLGTRNRLPVALAAPSMFTIYDAPPRFRDTLVLGISQSGQSPDIVSVLDSARCQGMLTAAITNRADSPLARAADRVIHLEAGEERSVAATKTYTAELMAVAMLSVALAPDAARVRDREALERVPSLVYSSLRVDAAIARRAERYRYMGDCAVIGRGYNYATAFEVALKLKELTYVGANPYSSADFMHGPIAVVGPGYPVVLVAPTGGVFRQMIALARELGRRSAELIAISNESALLDLAEVPLEVPSGVPEWLSPLVVVVPGQLLAYRLALAKGLDPQQPRGLHKVTETH